MKLWTMVVLLIGFTLACTGCLNVLTQTTVMGTLTENGLQPGPEFPGGIVTLSKGGNVIASVSLELGKADWRTACKPGRYELNVTSGGRTISRPVDTSNGSQTVHLDFDRVLIYGDVVRQAQPPSEQAPSVTVQLVLGERLVEEVLLDASCSFSFVAAPGNYDLRILSGSQLVVYPIDASVSRCRSVDLTRTSVIEGIIQEVGNEPTDWLGGKIRVEDSDGGLVESVAISGTQSRFAIPVKAGRYRLVAESAGRTVTSKMLDLSDSSKLTCTLNFDEVVLFGDLKSGANQTPQSSLTILQSGSIVRKVDFVTTDRNYFVVLKPGQYLAEVAIPSTGGLIRNAVKLTSGSQRFDIDLHSKATISGRVTENGLAVDVEAFPGGEVLLRTSDGVVRQRVDIKSDGTFEATVFSGLYTLTAVSEGRTLIVTEDASNGSLTVCIDFREVVLSGRVKMSNSSLPDSFPVSRIELVSTDGTRNIGLIRPQTPTFKAIIPKGVYSVRLHLDGTTVQVTVPIDGVVSRSCYREIDIGHAVSRVRGRISSPAGIPTSVVKVSLLSSGVSIPVASSFCDSSYNYDLYCTSNTYDLQIEGSKYVTRRYNDIYIGEGESVRDLEFTQCVVTYRFTLTTGLFNTPALFNVCINDWCYKIGDNTGNIVQRFVYPRGPIPAYTKVQWEVPVTLDIGTTYYLLVFGVDVGSVKKWTITPKEGQTVEMTVPLLLGS